MRYLLFILYCLAVSLTATAQNATVGQPSEPFPFQQVLYSPDSIAQPTEKIFSKKNNATLVAFWLTTCIPCAKELDIYAQNYALWKQAYGLEIVAISMDFAERFRKIEERLAAKSYPFPVYWDRIRSFKEIMPGGMNGYPQVFLFDKEGKLVWQKKGFIQGDEAKMIEQVILLK